MPTVILLGTLDTKGEEYDFLRRCLTRSGVDVLMVDCGVYPPRGDGPDVGAEDVAAAGGASLSELRESGDRGRAVSVMAEGAAAVLAGLLADGRLDGVLAMGGSGGTSLAAHAMRTLPVGVPKLIVSTVASGDTRPYVGARDIAMMYSVVDIAGINRLSARILANAAGAMAGMVRAEPPDVATRPLVGATMFGVTTQCVTAARERLEESGYEVLVFHATGTGGQSMEALAADGYLSGVLDITATELADELAGGIMSAGPDRLEMAGRLGLPQVVSLGALDMVNFGPLDSVPARYRDRRLYQHNENVTLMRTTPGECAELGRRLAGKLNAATGPAALFVPLRGVSAIAVDGGAFHDADADAALFEAVRANLDTRRVELVEMDTHINDPAFATAMADRFEEMTREHASKEAGV
ncbi:UPF0261 family protein [Actinobacteria bacterium YIM 96077]|uniref:UPF0261 family protein n=1 Tax=Phytoactinopolyspora halophila TaxID=1981511 RepID=A0A329QVB1_9ACTN|nr:Tm-1-like ATP-binding domain-containing protein [Phytoactinopolyspora halophila]AYY13878.1 UPF0261 family protein [Actinobacteria bacterium YIM 96077]RAW15579.1 UPF0261 family protein [Phytoactinopolyspora halophila]